MRYSGDLGKLLTGDPEGLNPQVTGHVLSDVPLHPMHSSAQGIPLLQSLPTREGAGHPDVGA